jgi:site-specific DNA recombinase
MAAGSHRPTSFKTRRVNRTYVLSGHRMEGKFNHDAHHYRCKFTSDRAPVPGLDHPKDVYIRESAIVPKLDAWIGELFDPANLDATCEALTMAGGANDTDHARIEAAKRKIEDCDQRLAKYRATLDAGADPVVVAGWMAGSRASASRQSVRSAWRSPRASSRKLRSATSWRASRTSSPCWPRLTRSSRPRCTKSSA